MVQLNELISGDEFVITKPWNGFEAGTRFVMEGRTDVFVYGPKWFDVHPRGKEDDVWMMENMEVEKC